MHSRSIANTETLIRYLRRSDNRSVFRQRFCGSVKRAGKEFGTEGTSLGGGSTEGRPNKATYSGSAGGARCDGIAAALE
jgi:hypothetical protein